MVVGPGICKTEYDKTIIRVNTYFTAKQQYIDSIRSKTAYPVYRDSISAITLFGRLLWEEGVLIVADIGDATAETNLMNADVTWVL